MQEFWLMKFGLLLDLWQCHRLEIGVVTEVKEETIDDAIPLGI